MTLRSHLLLAFFLLAIFLAATPSFAQEAGESAADGDAAGDADLDDADAEGAEEGVQDEYEELEEQFLEFRKKYKEPEHPLTDIPGEHEDVVIKTLFLGNDKVLVAGEPTTMVIGLHNVGDKFFNIDYVMGSLNSPTAFSKHEQNLTFTFVNRTLFSTNDVTLEYLITPWERLPAKDYTLAVTVFYSRHLNAMIVEGAPTIPYAATVVNHTVAVRETLEPVDNTAFYVVSSLVTAMAVALAASYGQIKAAMRRKKRAAKTAGVETGTKETVDDEWLEDHKAMLNAQKGQGEKKKKAN